MVYYASWSQIVHVVGIPRLEVDAAVTRLQAEGATAIGVPVDGVPGTWLVSSGRITPDRSTCLAL
jgi:hypothetical protein